MVLPGSAMVIVVDGSIVWQGLGVVNTEGCHRDSRPCLLSRDNKEAEMMETNIGFQ